MAEKKKQDEAVEETPEKTDAPKEQAAEEKSGSKAPKKTKSKKPAAKAKVSEETSDSDSGPAHKRAEKVGIVFSDKMTKTVVVRVDRTVKHALYHKYMKKRKKFMAHNEMGAAEGDKVRIVETRPLSARKRWRVVEIIQKAER